MTEAAQVHSASLPRTDLEIHYTVAMPQPETHLFEVTLQIKGWQSTVLDLKMPVWTPGSYLVREYARHLQDFKATTGNQPLKWQKLGKSHWQVDTTEFTAHDTASLATEITVRYRVYANELTVRTNHLDKTHGYFNGAALFFYLPGFEQQPIRVTIVPPNPEWHIATCLPAIASQDNTFEAADFDTLVDSPFEIGLHLSLDFEVVGKPHQLVIWGMGNPDPDQIILDIKKIIESEAALFGGVPYDRYLFLLHLAPQGFGGLEHKNSCSLIYSRFGFHSEERYYRFLQLVAHEFFHLWNVKRIRPQALEAFDYAGENYTPSLWFSEGTTSYYDLVFPMRAGIYDSKTFLKNLGKEISRYLTTPGRQVQPLSESSFDAWIKLYRRDNNSDNSQISYYLKGEMVSLLLDLLIRAQHHNRRSLDDVMRQLWQQFGQPEIGFTPEQLESVIASVAGIDLSDFFQRYLHTTEELAFDTYLEPFGLRLQPEDTSHLPPFLGLTAKSEHGREWVKFVESGSPAQQVGIDADDELLALDGLRIKASELNDRLKDYQPGARVYVSVFHQDELCTHPVTLAAPRPTSYQLVAIDQPSPTQQANLKGWLGKLD